MAKLHRHKRFLYRLQASCLTNMLGAGRYVMRGFKVDEERAAEIVQTWMDGWDQAEYDEALIGREICRSEFED